MTRVLFLTPNHPDYLTDGLFHGLRSLLGDDVVELPKLDFAYDTYSPERRADLYGRGFSLYGLLPDIAIDRTSLYHRANEGEFDLVVFADIWNTFGLFTYLAPILQGRTPMAVVDGADRVEPYPYSEQWWRHRLWWTLPRAHKRALYFKREIAPLTGTFRTYLLLPPWLGASRLPSIRAMREISFSIPEGKIVTELPPKDRLIASHVVDPEVAALIGAETSYQFDEEDDYYRDLRRARFGITTKRAGWDCLRHYELAANGCVPCFRALGSKPPRCAPHGLDESNCVPYNSATELLSLLDEIDDQRYAELQAGALAWARANSTRRRAAQFLSGCGFETAGF